MGVHRSAIRRRRREDACTTKARNKTVKSDERERRDARMMEKVQAGSLPYTPIVMSWLSRKLDKRAIRITPEDVKSLAP